MSEKIAWTPELLTKEFANLPNSEGANLLKISEWAISNNRFLKSRAKAATFGIVGRKGSKIFSIYGNGEMRIFLELKKYPEGVEERDDILRWLRIIQLIAVKPKTVDAKRSILSSRKVTQLDSQGLIFLFGILNQACFGWNIRKQKIFPWSPKILTKYLTSELNHKWKNPKREIRKRKIQKRILDWAVTNKRFEQNNSFWPAFGIVGNKEKEIFSFSSSGIIYITVNKDYYPHGAPQRDNLVNKLKEINLLKDDYNPEETTIDWKIASRLLEKLSDSEVDILLDIFEEFCL